MAIAKEIAPSRQASHLRPGWGYELWLLNALSRMSLVEISLVLLCKVRLLGRQVVFGEDCILRANVGAVAAVDALIGVDEYLRNGSSGGVARRGRNGGGGALRYANKIQRAGIGNYIGHDERLLDCSWALAQRGNPQFKVTRPWAK